MTAEVIRGMLPIHRHEFKDTSVIEVESLAGEVVSWLCPECLDEIRPWHAPNMALGSLYQPPLLAAWLDKIEERVTNEHHVRRGLFRRARRNVQRRHHGVG